MFFFFSGVVLNSPTMNSPTMNDKAGLFRLDEKSSSFTPVDENSKLSLNLSKNTSTDTVYSDVGDLILTYNNNISSIEPKLTMRGLKCFAQETYSETEGKDFGFCFFED